jgi:flagellar FliJ protein
MTPPRVWQHLTDMARSKRDQSAHKLRTAVSKRGEAERKLATLVGYRRDYLAKLEAATRAGIKADGFANYRAFIANLDRAIEQQEAVLASMHTDVGFAQTDWQHTQTRVDSLDVLDKRRAQTAAKHEARREQKLTDEYAARRSRGGGDD